jgi:AraC-like DNA-binding protein/CheY-like chemotaxis protein
MVHSELRLARFGLVTAGHHFLLTALPFRRVHSRAALTSFIETANQLSINGVDRDAILIELLAVLEPHTGGRIPSVVDRYLELRRTPLTGLERFRQCVEEVLRYRGVDNPHVQQAIACIHESHGDAGLRQSQVAEAVGLTTSGLSAAFKTHTGVAFHDYLRDVRLSRAARLLARTSQSIKQVWAAVGYNDASNFTHDFKDRFAVTPTAYRARGNRSSPAGPSLSTDDRAPIAPEPLADAPDRPRILIVDDDRGSRETVTIFLQRKGYGVVPVASGRDALYVLARCRPAVIILDYHLADMPGSACLRAIRALSGSGIPAVVVFTADLHVEDDAEIRGLGATVVSKLCDLEEFERVIQSLSLLGEASITMSEDRAGLAAAAS